ncbi:MAG: hypothetical protein RLZZ584_2462 [Pseudomonadota bacterium]
MSSTTLPAMRIKSRWFKPGEHHDAGEQAGAMAFICWRVSHQLVKRLRVANFDIDAGPAYFGVLREALVFFCTVCDRVVHERLTPEDRVAFVIALVRHAARHYGENAQELLGPAPAGAGSHQDVFIDAFNEASPQYADYPGQAAPRRPAAGGGADDSPDHLTTPGAGHPVAAVGFQPGFAYVRHFAGRIQPHLPLKDRQWVIDQLMALDVPDSLEIIQRALRELFDPAPRARRRATLGGE